jgi:hypothetical protein
MATSRDLLVQLACWFLNGTKGGKTKAQKVDGSASAGTARGGVEPLYFGELI